ncbi:MAG: hypothetical protein ACI95C_000749 [Pseudohongiellaceae bacterium]|jgi:hypothetical protein
MKQTLAQTRYPKDAEFGLFSLTHGDPLGSFIGRFSIRSPLYAVAIAATLSFSAALLASFEGSLYNPDLSLDLLHDIGWWNQFLLAFPTLLFISGSYFGAFPKTLRGLADSGVIQATEQQWKKVRRLTHAKLKNLTFILLPYVGGITAAFLTTNVLDSNSAWFSADDYIAGWLIPPHAFFLYFFMTYLALRLYTAYLVLKLLFSFSVNIQPFHADGCGGLGSLRDQSKKLYWGMIAFGVIAGLGVLTNSLVYGVALFSLHNGLMMFAYFLLTGIAFFLPLYALSGSMQLAKQNLIDSINARYRTLNENSESRSDRTLNAEQKEDLKALTQLHRTARSMKVWPFDKDSLVKFGFAMTTPAFVVFLGMVFQ